MLYDVIIVGFGPVGQVAANLLGRDGARVAAFEVATSIYNLPRAAHFDAEVMRVFQAVGLTDAIAGAISPVRGMHFLDAGRKKLFGFDAPDPPTANGWPAGFMFYQPDLEAALQGGVRRFSNVDVFQGHEVLEVTNETDRVSVRARDLANGRERTLVGSYVWGCDGARSITRKSIGAELEDLQFDQPWLVVDTMLKREVDLPELALQICDPARPVTFVPSAGRHRRWEFMLMPGETAEEMERPERVRELLSPWVTDEDTEVVRAVVYSFHALIAEKWREGRVFLAGDAAHQMPPFLGQGMCAGIRDVNNLAWKLNLVRRGFASEHILESYQSERSAHVRTIIERAVQAGRIIQTTDPDVAARRDEMFKAANRTSITIGDDEGPLPSRMPALAGGIVDDTPPAGQLFPQSRVASASGDEVLLDDVLGSGFALVVAEEVPLPPAGCDETLPGLRRVRVLSAAGSEQAFADVREVVDMTGLVSSWLSRHGSALVRPDRYVYGTARSAGELVRLGARLREQIGYL